METMQNFLITVVVLALVVVGGYYLLSASPQPTSTDEMATTTDQNEQDTGTTSTAVPDDWVVFESDQYGLTFEHPQEADLTENQERKFVKVQVTGPDQEPNTEVTDGYTLWIAKASATSSVAEVAERQLAEETQNTQTVKEVARSTINGRTAYTFANETELGNTAYHVLWSVEDNMYMDITYSISGSEDDMTSYRESVNTIIRTVRSRD